MNPGFAQEADLAAQRPPLFLEGSRPACPLDLRGPVCDTAFTHAYRAHGFPPSYARAVLLQLTALPAPASLVPRIVREYFARPRPESPAKERCIGCSLTELTAAAVRTSYRSWIHPDVDEALVRVHAREARPVYAGIADLPDDGALDDELGRGGGGHLLNYGLEELDGGLDGE